VTWGGFLVVAKIAMLFRTVGLSIRAKEDVIVLIIEKRKGFTRDLF
jgi:hypothetical protein